MISRILFLFLVTSLFVGTSLSAQEEETDPYIVLLGIAQDGGYPHIGCERQCCQPALDNDSLSRFVASAALVDPQTRQWWLLEATPDIKGQLHLFRTLTGGTYPMLPAGILLTHAHIGHYTGLIQLGKEALNSKAVPVYAMPRMKTYLATNGPWSQLVGQENIVLMDLSADSVAMLNERVSITPVAVPHRDEFTETVGFVIEAGERRYLFLPDIDKWHKWDRELSAMVQAVDYAFVDGTFYTQNELPYRNIQTIPHPLVVETMELLELYPKELTSKVVFFHFNHTNPLLWIEAVRTKVEREGFGVGVQGQRY